MLFYNSKLLLETVLFYMALFAGYGTGYQVLDAINVSNNDYQADFILWKESDTQREPAKTTNLVYSQSLSPLGYIKTYSYNTTPEQCLSRFYSIFEGKNFVSERKFDTKSSILNILSKDSNVQKHHERVKESLMENGFSRYGISKIEVEEYKHYTRIIIAVLPL